MGVYMTSIYGITKEELENYFINLGEKKFKATQVYEWIYRKKINSFQDMSNIKKTLLEQLTNDFYFDDLEILSKKEDIDVKKYLFKLEDGNKIEAVLMNHDYGNSLCISTQVGCNMSCSFCESGRLKKIRNLNANEMILQILKIQEDLNIRISHVVLMGIGEPFDNYENVIKFINIVNDPYGIALGSRHITVSTSGIVPKILDFIEDGKQVNLAISLHAPNDELRSKIMPINKAYNIKKLMEAINKYINKTNRRVTFEYIMLKDVNDTDECAIQLSSLLKGMNCYVNLIPYNETTHIEYKKSSKEKILRFYDILKKNKINVTIRREFGSKVNAACGQLRSNYEEGI